MGMEGRRVEAGIRWELCPASSVSGARGSDKDRHAGIACLQIPLSPPCLLSPLHTAAQIILLNTTSVVMYPLSATFTQLPTGSRANSPAGVRARVCGGGVGGVHRGMGMVRT